MHWINQEPAVPSVEGWYRVMLPGDSESMDGFTLYEFPDYETWGYWSPASPEEYEDFADGYKGSWTVEMGEPDGLFAYAGPIAVPTPYKAS